MLPAQGTWGLTAPPTSGAGTGTAPPLCLSHHPAPLRHWKGQMADLPTPTSDSRGPFLENQKAITKTTATYTQGPSLSPDVLPHQTGSPSLLTDHTRSLIYRQLHFLVWGHQQDKITPKHYKEVLGNCQDTDRHTVKGWGADHGAWFLLP